jgi:hypothetical protein
MRGQVKVAIDLALVALIVVLVWSRYDQPNRRRLRAPFPPSNEDGTELREAEKFFLAGNRQRTGQVCLTCSGTAVLLRQPMPGRELGSRRCF